MPPGRQPPVRDDRLATESEVRAEIEALTTAEVVRLLGFARTKARSLRRGAYGTAAEDLLQQALLTALVGTRRWRPGRVDFYGFILGAISSIVSHLRRCAPGGIKVPLREGDLATDDEPAPIDGHARTEATAEQQLIDRDQLQVLEKHLGDDDEAALVVDGWRSEKTGPEIQADLGLSQSQYETIARRIRRQARPYLDGGRNG